MTRAGVASRDAGPGHAGPAGQGPRSRRAPRAAPPPEGEARRAWGPVMGTELPRRQTPSTGQEPGRDPGRLVRRREEAGGAAGVLADDRHLRRPLGPARTTTASPPPRASRASARWSTSSGATTSSTALTPQSLRRMLEELGPTFVKAGQILSMRSEILPESFTRELARLRTSVEPMDRDTVISALRAEYDRPIEDIFDAIDDRPLGSASVAQVHKARLVTGEVVAGQGPAAARAGGHGARHLHHPLARALREPLHGRRAVHRPPVRGGRALAVLPRGDGLPRGGQKPRGVPPPTTRAAPSSTAPDPTPRSARGAWWSWTTSRAFPSTTPRASWPRATTSRRSAPKLADNYTSQMLDDGFFHADPHPRQPS